MLMNPVAANENISIIKEKEHEYSNKDVNLDCEAVCLFTYTN